MKRRRHMFKGANLFHIPDLCEDHYGMLDLFQAARETIDLFWCALLSDDAFWNSLFAVPAKLFWPQGHSQNDMLERTSRDILKAIAGLKWRLLQKAKEFPYRLLAMCRDNASDDFMRSQLEEFKSTPVCCLDFWWGKQVHEVVTNLADPREQLACLKKHVDEFNSNARAVSSREETMHAQQRKVAAGWKASSPAFDKQAAEIVLRTSWANFSTRCRVKKGMPAAVKAAARLVRKQQVKHKRPRQWGNALYSYVASRRKENPEVTFEALKIEWAGLGEAARAQWKAKQRFAVSTRRFQSKLAREHMQKQPAEVVPTPLGLGNNSFPLRPDLLEEFVGPYRQKATGMQLLEALGTPDSKSMIDSIRAGAKYHSMEAAVVGAKAILGRPVTNQRAEGPPWRNISKCPRGRKCCSQLHPGLCQTRDSNIIAEVNTLWQSFPKIDGCILMLEITVRSRDRRNPIPSKAVAFVRMVTGLGSVEFCSGCFRQIVDFFSRPCEVCEPFLVEYNYIVSYQYHIRIIR